jgi:hypothetical protein
MKSKILSSLPRIYSLSLNSDYTRFIPKESVEELTKQRWEKIGERLYRAIEEVDPYIVEHDETKKKNSEKQNCSCV